MAAASTTCNVCIDSDEILSLYQKLRVEVTADLDAQFDLGRINGNAYVETYAKLMDRIIGSSIGAIVDMQTKETDADRDVKASVVNKNNVEAEELVKATDSKIALNAAQENKLACDCCNASKIADADVVLKAQQGQLYDRQRQGFDDNARQKLFETQMSGFSMVFADTALEEVVAPMNEKQICETYNAVKAGLGISGSACE